jgi:hypothetical protein
MSSAATDSKRHPANEQTTSTSRRPLQPILNDPEGDSESDEEPPPYSRLDPLSQEAQQPRGPNPPLPNSNTQPGNGSQPEPGQGPSYPPIPGQNTMPQSWTPPFQYPPGYLCQKCHNTGIKPTGSPCGTCARLFGKQTANVDL